MRHRCLLEFVVISTLLKCSVIASIDIPFDNEIKFGEASLSRVSADQVEEFMRWLEDQGVEHNVRLTNDQYGGLRGITNEPIETGKNFMRIPFATLMTTFGARQSDLKEVFEHPEYNRWSTGPLSPPVTALALHILYEKNSPNSRWGPYIAMLPQTTDTTLLWSDEELKELVGSWVYDRTINDMEKIESEYNSLFPKLFENFPHMFQPEKYSLEGFKWAFTMIWSRSFTYQTADHTQEMAMAPLADMLNHKHSSKTHFFFADNFTDILVNSEDRYEEGEEVFNNFGQRSNSDILHLWGFAVDNNPDNAVKVNVELDPNDPYYDIKNNKLTALGIYWGGYPYSNIPVLDGVASAALVMMLRIKHFIVPKSETDAAAAIDKVEFREKVDQTNEDAVERELIDICEKALNRYTTTIEEDQKILDSKKFKSYRHELAVKVRLEEKQMLKKLADSFQSRSG